MEYFKSHYNIISTVFFVLIIIVAHFIASNGYDFRKNTISDLGAQGYDKKIIMQIGFVLFGLSIATGTIINGFTWRTSPILVYGICIALTGLFCTKPFFGIETYSTSAEKTHSIFAQIAGVSFSLGIFIQLFFTTNNTEKLIHLVFFILVLGLSISFGLLKNNQGIAQRLLYLTSFVWLIKYYKPN